MPNHINTLIGLLLLSLTLGLVQAETVVPPTIVTETPGPTGYIEDPSDSATTGDSGSSAGEQTDNICLRCYDKVRVAQDNIAIQTNLIAKEKKLIHRKNKAAEAAAARAAAAPPTPVELSDNSDSSNTQQTSSSTTTRPLTRLTQTHRKSTTTTTNSTIRNRTLPSPVVISSLRVARAAPSLNGETFARPKKVNSSKKDPELKQLKQEQQQQLNVTCKSLLAVQECLNELSRTCIGDLQFHSLEVYSEQWHTKLHCPYRSNPKLRVFEGLRTFREEEPEKVPRPRPISSEEEVRKRLDQMFPNGRFRPFGVMLKPTLTSSATQQFNSAQQRQSQYVHQQSDDVRLQSVYTYGKIVGVLVILMALIALLAHWN